MCYNFTCGRCFVMLLAAIKDVVDVSCNNMNVKFTLNDHKDNLTF